GNVNATFTGEVEWAAPKLLNAIREGPAVIPIYRSEFARIRERGTLSLGMGIWQGLRRRPQQIVASTTFARGCKLDCHFCAVFLTNGATVRNRDVDDVVEEIRGQGPACTRDTIGSIEPGFYNSLLKAVVRLPVVGRLYGDRLIVR